MEDWEYDTHWIEPAAINYREITDWPHLNKCVSTLEVCSTLTRLKCEGFRLPLPLILTLRF